MKKIYLLPIALLSVSVSAQQNHLTHKQLGGELSIAPTHSQLKNSGTNSVQSVTSYSYGTPRALTELNDAANSDAYPWISENGLHLYYTSGANANGLMYASRANLTDNFSAPVLVPTSVSNTHQYWLSNNELDMYASTPNSSTIYYHHRNSVMQAFNLVDSISLNVPGNTVPLNFWNVSLNQAQTKLYVAVNDGTNCLGIYEFDRSSSNSFTFNQDFQFPEGFSVRSGQLSKDELYFFFSASDNSANFKMYQFNRTDAAISFDYSTISEVGNLNNPADYNAQPNVSGNLEWIVFVRNATDWWSDNELYIAQKEAGTSGVVGLNNLSTQNVVEIYPNPSKAKFVIKGAESSMEVYNLLGEKIMNLNEGANEIDLTGKPKGIYFVKFANNKKEMMIKKIILD